MRERTFTEQARRAQLIDVTIDQVAEHGYPATSLARIAAAAGITKAAVIYHFASKNALVEAAHAQVLSALVATVGAAVDAAGPAGAPAAYVRSMIGHLRANPRHTRMIIEAMTNVVPPEQLVEQRAARWSPLAELLRAARAAHGLADDVDLRTAALIIGGGIDAIVQESLSDPSYDTTPAAELLIEALQLAWLAPQN
ncbi:TetR family transcriptional regulator [Kribbella sandramycini]|uniref:AcrR family transcriptional regulator n=1 Tax=Kribbella sandramycini TaxID=60450 RepID=A0A7Y4L5M1_9ACTN|nr:TetR/AcrR family transcriptional regulator [Kribbella sandramycini]MBB6567111.1 AcrR family transcriptional regulator [Kribbella sandramycini]NOL44828.1 TetR family transcriptional regulator [Kribbella sandramycini]